MRHEVVMPMSDNGHNTFLSERRVFHFKHAFVLQCVCVWCVVVAAFETTTDRELYICEMDRLELPGEPGASAGGIPVELPFPFPVPSHSCLR